MKSTLDYASTRDDPRQRVTLPRSLIDTIILRCIVLIPACAGFGLLGWAVLISLPGFAEYRPWPEIAANLSAGTGFCLFAIGIVQTVRSHKRRVEDYFRQEAREYVENRPVSTAISTDITPASHPDTQSTPSHPPSDH